MFNNSILIISCFIVLIIYSFLMIFNKSIMTIQLNDRNILHDYKIALCISGEVRDISTIDHFISQIIMPLNINNNCDIYLHCSFRDVSIKEKYLSLLKPKLVIEKRINSNNLVEIVYGRIYELHNAIQKEYDIYVRVRPDIILSKPLTSKDLDMAYKGNLCCTMILSSLYVLMSKRFISDTLFIVNKEVMDQISNIYNLYKYNKSSCNNPESLLYNYIHTLNINIYYIRSELSLTDYHIQYSKKKEIYKMLSKIKDLPLLDINSCSVNNWNFIP